ncbi:hypothetical protein AI2668V1_2079 [Citrobacter freundii]|uniref:hypothetical protein n=1 Tax=Citrobacter freundii TaxID=546 RepID=UPI001DA09563|nr:hypothetical protein [Citrobacter freundii]CAE7408727.1 hypothetical protein AI2668V1_2079 [Citrobacter freundii]CAH3669054.1 hypothetical protein AI2668V1_2079 [Citrobacter freundii]
MKPDVKKIIADIKATKGNRKFCNGLAGTLQDDNYASSICKYVKTVTPERIDLLIEYAEKLETEVTDLAVQLANAESKCMEQAAEISRRDEIFIPVYPDNNLMNKMTDVFHDTAKIHCDEDCIFVDNAELVITSIINNYIKSDDAFLAEVRASARNEGINYAASRLAAAYNHGFVDNPLAEVYDVVRMILTAKEDLANDPAADGLSGEYAEKSLAEFAAQLRKGAAL